ncbi:hypothetical protein EDB19DRAFT_505767 [Suillus lakei]|nr:hypothetical protein EDB19DRAFT_505767 [Suillus lakei]
MCHQFAFLLSTVFFAFSLLHLRRHPRAAPAPTTSCSYPAPMIHHPDSLFSTWLEQLFLGDHTVHRLSRQKLTVPYCQGKHRSATARENPRPIPLNSEKRYCKQLMTHQLCDSGSGIFATTGCCPHLTFPCGYFLNLQLRRSAVTPH